MGKKKNKGGAIAIDPQPVGGGWSAPKGNKAQQSEIAKYQAIVAKKGVGNAPKAEARLQALGALGTDPNPNQNTGQAPAPDFNSTTQGAYGAINNILPNVTGQMPTYQGEQPGNYGDMRQQAYNSVYDPQKQELDKRFGQEEQQFRNRMAEQGIPEGSKLYSQQFDQMKGSQNQAYQNAQNQAFQFGQGEQAQMFGQADTNRNFGYNQLLNQSNYTLQSLGALSPFYNQGAQSNMLGQQQGFESSEAQKQFERQKQLAKQQQGYAMQLQAGQRFAPNHNLTFDQQMALQNAQLYGQAAISGLGQPQQPQGQGVAGGLGQGIGTGLAIGATRL